MVSCAHGFWLCQDPGQYRQPGDSVRSQGHLLKSDYCDYCRDSLAGLDNSQAPPFYLVCSIEASVNHHRGSHCAVCLRRLAVSILPILLFFLAMAGMPQDKPKPRPTSPPKPNQNHPGPEPQYKNV